MRTQCVLAILFIFFTGLSSAAQAPGAVDAGAVQDRQTPAINTALPPALEQFSGSGTVDKLVPGVIQLGLLDAIDRGLKHNLGFFFPNSRQSWQGRNIGGN